MVKFIAHRGNNYHNFNENTINAIKDVLDKEYIDGVEIDVRLTKDKKVILYHNPTIFLNGKIRLINKLNLKDLYKENIDTIDSLKKIKTNKIILIEIKYKGRNYKEVVDIIYKKISNYNLNIYLCSFNYKLINHFKKKYNYKCGYIISKLFNYYRLFNSLDFNVIKYNLYSKLSQKETFIWTVNSKKNIKKLNTFNGYIISDYSYKLYQ